METLIHITSIYCYLLLIWVLIQWAKIIFQYTNTPEGYKAALQEFKEHCEAKERLKHDKNFGIKIYFNEDH